MPKVIGALAGLPGIIETDAFYPEKETRVVYDPALIEIEQIIQTLSQAGYFGALKEPVDLPPALPTLSTRNRWRFGRMSWSVIASGIPGKLLKRISFNTTVP